MGKSAACKKVFGLFAHTACLLGSKVRLKSIYSNTFLSSPKTVNNTSTESQEKLDCIQKHKPFFNF